MQTKPAQPRAASDPPARPQYRTVAVFGLNAIGRQVALQLAALGVGRLVLVDPGRVSRRHYAAEGFAAEDVGRPKAQAAAQAAHQLNPLLDIETSRTHPLDPGFLPSDEPKENESKPNRLTLDLVP